MDFGRRCTRFKTVMTKDGPARRCANFAGAGEELFGDDMGFGQADRSGIAGPLIGGGVAQVGTIATKLIFKGKPIAKWASAVGLGLGGIVSGILAFRPTTRGTGISGLVTVGLVTVPRLLEDLLGVGGTMKDSLGLTVPERELDGAEEELLGDEMEGAGDIELLDAGAGSTGVLGVITPERELSGGDFGQDVRILGREEPQMFGEEGGQQPIEMLHGFGSNFLAAQ